MATGPAGRVADRRRPSEPVGEPSRRSSELVIGRHPIEAALRSGRRINRLMVAEGADSAGVKDVVRLATERSVRVQIVPRERLDALSEHHQGIVADAAPFSYAELEDVLSAVTAAPAERPPLLVAVDSVQDPQNFGSLLRTAVAAGAAGAIVPERRSVGVTPAVGRASAGAIERLPIARVVNLPRALEAAKQAGLWVVGLDGGGRVSYDEVDLTVPLLVVVGAEGSGLGRLVAESCDVVARLPMVGPIDSLNAAVAGSIVLYEALRQRRSLAARQD